MLPDDIRKHIDAVRQFSSDGCTFAPEFDCLQCCLEHDYYYHTGCVSRAEADRLLRECFKASGRPVIAWIYWAGVRLFGRGKWQHKE